MHRVVSLIVALVACYGAAAAGSVFTSSSVGTWYQALHKPTFNPPSWVFGPVWTALYGMMACAVWLVWLNAGPVQGRLPLLLFVAQLLLNVGWSFVFFGLRRPGWAFAEICLLWLAIGGTLVSFWRISQAAGWMMIPYLLWVSFAAALNLKLWLLNQ